MKLSTRHVSCPTPTFDEACELSESVESPDEDDGEARTINGIERARRHVRSDMITERAIHQLTVSWLTPQDTQCHHD